ncbi:hypothetical protein J4411_03070 [Candidatus Pacearchaeota archaeon]|nr:hypothetical protein [Candidatus Pacearchaeota archaeon]
MAKDDFHLKVELTPEERERNARILGRVIEFFLVPVLMGILIGIGNWITISVALFWWGFGIYGLFVDKEAFVIQIVLMVLFGWGKESS